MTCRQAGIRDIVTWETLWDVIAYGLFFGFVIRVLEGAVYMATTGMFALDRLSPFASLESSEYVSNNPLLQTGFTMTVVGLIVAAVAEELFYRGSMIYQIEWMTGRQGFDQKTAKLIALLSQASFFAVLHAAVYQQISQILALFVGGLVFGLVFLWKRDLSVCIIAHLTVNLSALSPLVGQYLLDNPLYLLLLGLAVALLVYIIIRRRDHETTR
ncbi:MAG: lysostaphin resistance A-like protein [Candidatus Thorarchaeota archaeon]